MKGEYVKPGFPLQEAGSAAYSVCVLRTLSADAGSIHQCATQAQTSAASIYGGRQSSMKPAAACGTGHCPADPSVAFGDSSPFKGACRHTHASPEKGRCLRSGQRGSFKDPERFSLWRSGSSPEPAAAEVGNANMSFPGHPGKPQNSGSPIYASRIRR